MMQTIVDNVLGIAKESIKTITQESFNNTVKLINGLSALILAVLPGRSSVMEGVQGWELRPSFRAPRLPRWMEEGVSSFNRFIDEYESDSEWEADSDCADDVDTVSPSSPCSTASQFSRFSSGSRHEKNAVWVRRSLRFLSWPLRALFDTSPARGGSRCQSRSSSALSLHRMYLQGRQMSGMKDFGTHDSDHRRRGVIEDLQLLMELGIERFFDFIRYLSFPLFSPLETLKALVRKIVLGDVDPTDAAPTGRYHRNQSLNTDSRTCQDIITSLGYPYEAVRVTTPDGHVLLLERIPRRQSNKVLYLQHGLLDSSLGWVSNGVVGSQAFAAYDQGYDVFLGNFRGLASREHVNKHISPQRYWRYSINEHGTLDIPSMINKLHEIKKCELKHLETDGEEEEGPGTAVTEDQPYKLCAVAHSLGGAGLLMYVVTRRLEGKPHRLSRLILLSPAGFHEKAPPACAILQYALPALAPLLAPIVPGFYIPTKFFRMLFNKLARDFQNYPALGGLVQILMSYVVGGDSSNWIGAFGQSHYNMDDMPGVAYRVAMHLAQMMRTKRFIMYDFGSPAANFEAYGTPYPLDIGANYGVIDIPVDVVAGKKDRLVPKSMVLKHYQTLKVSGCKASYEEFEYAHLDFTFSHKEELLAYVMSRLLLVSPQTSNRSRSGTNGSDNGRGLRNGGSKKSGKKSLLTDDAMETKNERSSSAVNPKLLDVDGGKEGACPFEATKSVKSHVAGPGAGSSLPSGRDKHLSQNDEMLSPAPGSSEKLPQPSALASSECNMCLSPEGCEYEVGSRYFGSSSFFAFPASHVASVMTSAAKHAANRKMEKSLQKVELFNDSGLRQRRENIQRSIVVNGTNNLGADRQAEDHSCIT